MGRRRLFIAIAGAIALIAGVLASGVTAVGAPACTKTWNHGALTDNFTDAANWAPVGVPGASDHVCVPTSGGGTQVVYASGTTTIASIQHSAGGDLPLVITGGALNISDVNDSTFDTLQQSAGTLGGTSVLHVTNFTWTGGTQTTPNGGPFSTLPGSGATIVSGTLAIDSPSANPATYNPGKSLARALEVAGTATSAYLGGANNANNWGMLDLNGLSGKLQIDSGVTFNVKDDQDITGYSTPVGVIVAAGATIQKFNGPNDSNISPTFVQNGTLNVQSGTLAINGNGGGLADTGSYNVAAGATLGFGGTRSINNGTGVVRIGGTGTANGVFNGGGVTFVGSTPYQLQTTSISGGTNVFNGSTGTGPLTVSGGTSTFSGSTTSVASISQNGGTINFNQPISPATITQSAGTLGGTATVTVADFTWTGGTQTTPNGGAFNDAPGTGATLVSNSLSIDSPSANPAVYNPAKSLGRKLELQSSVVTASLGGFNSNDNWGMLDLNGLSGKLQIDSGVTFNVKDDQDITGYSTPVGVVVNSGATFTKTNTAGGTSSISPTFVQNGTLNVQNGTLAINGNGGGSADTGSYNVAAGATLGFGGTRSINNATGVARIGGVGTANGFFSGGGVTFVGTTPYQLQTTSISGGTNVFNGSTATGPLAVSGGNSTFNGSPTSVASINLTNGTVAFNQPISPSTLTQSAGTLGGTATVTTGTFNWTGGTQVTPNGGTFNDLPGTGATIATTVTIDSPSANPAAYNPYKSLQRLLEVTTTGTLGGFNNANNWGFLDFGGLAGKLQIDAPATFTMKDDQDMSGYGIGVVNLGTLARNGGTGDSYVQPPVTQNGTVNVLTGTLRFGGNGGASADTGSYNVADQATLGFYSGTRSINSSGGIARIGGSGTANVFFSGAAVTLVGATPYSVQSTSVSGGSVAFNGPTTTGPVALSGGTATFNGTTSPIASVDQSGGTLGGTATLNVTTYNWTGGTQVTPNGGVFNDQPGTGKTVVGTLTIDAPSVNPAAYNPYKSLQRLLEVTTTGTLGGFNNANNWGFLDFGGLSGKLQVDNGATFTIKDDQDMSGTGIGVVNLGTIARNGGTGDSFIQPPVTQNGTVNVLTGTLRFGGNGGASADTGSYNVADQATLGFYSGTRSIDSAGGIKRSGGSGTASVFFSGAAVTLSATTPYSVQSTSVSAGSATFGGTTTTGALSISGGTATFNNATTTIASVTQSAGTLGGTAVLTIPTYLWTGGTQITPNGGPFNDQPGLGKTVVGNLTIDSPSANPAVYNPLKSLQRLLEVTGTGVLQGYNSTNNWGMLDLGGVSGKLQIDNGATFTIADDQDITGTGIGVLNQGTLTRNGGTGDSFIQPALTQNGTLNVLTGLLRVYSTPNLSGSTLTGGTWHVVSTLGFQNGAINTNAATLILDGAQAQVDNISTGAANDGLNGFAANGAAGDLRIVNGKSLTTPTAGGPFTNDGNVTVGSASTLTATGGLLNQATGTVQGNGTVARAGGGTPSLTNAGTVRPGSSPGILHVTGDYTQTSGGTLVEDITGTATPGTDFDQLQVTGAANLDGTLQVVTTAVNPLVNTAIQAITHASRTGQFATVNGKAIDANLQWDPGYLSATHTDLIVTTDRYPIVAIANSSTAEGDVGSHNAPVTVTLDQATRRTVTLHYATSDGTAVATAGPSGPPDYTATSGTLVFSPGEISKNIQVPVLGDTLNEANETLSVTLSQEGATPTNANATLPGPATLTINDDDLPPVASIKDEKMAPRPSSGTGTLSVPVKLSAPSGRTVTIHFATSDGTATAGSDYTEQHGDLTFTPTGSTTQNVDVQLLPGAASASTEDFSLTLSLPPNSNATLDPTAKVAHLVIVGGQAAAPPVVPAGSIDDVQVAEANSGTTTARFIATLDQATTVPVGVNFATADGTAKAGSDYTARSGTLTFAPGQTAKVVDIDVLGGTAAKPDRTFTVVLSSPSAMTIAKGTGTGSIIGHKVDQSGVTPTTPPAPTPPATPPPAAPPVTAQQQQQNELPVKVTGKTKTLAPNVVAVELSCPRATVICAGSFELQLKGKRIGRATFFVKPAETRFISIRLFSAPAAIFQKAGKLAPLMKGTMRDGKDFSANPKFTALKKK